MRAYRLAKARYADTALDGSGAKAHGGRWNSKGVPMVYASDSIALAALELLVHLHRGDILNQYRLYSLELPDDSVLSLDVRALPPDWRRDPAPMSTAKIGDEWAASLQSPALAVPSTVVPSQQNILLNPAHEDFHKLIADATNAAFDFDPRLII